MELSDEHLKKYSWLMAGAAIQRAQIKANPVPHLVRASERIKKLETAIETALLCLSGADDFDIKHAAASKPELVDIVETSTARNTRAYDVLRTAINKD